MKKKQQFRAKYLSHETPYQPAKWLKNALIRFRSMFTDYQYYPTPLNYFANGLSWVVNITGALAVYVAAFTIGIPFTYGLILLPLLRAGLDSIVDILTNDRLTNALTADEFYFDAILTRIEEKEVFEVFDNLISESPPTKEDAIEQLIKLEHIIEKGKAAREKLEDDYTPEQIALWVAEQRKMVLQYYYKDSSSLPTAGWSHLKLVVTCFYQDITRPLADSFVNNVLSILLERPAKLLATAFLIPVIAATEAGRMASNAAFYVTAFALLATKVLTLAIINGPLYVAQATQYLANNIMTYVYELVKPRNVQIKLLTHEPCPHSYNAMGQVAANQKVEQPDVNNQVQAEKPHVHAPLYGKKLSEFPVGYPEEKFGESYTHQPY